MTFTMWSKFPSVSCLLSVFIIKGCSIFQILFCNDWDDHVSVFPPSFCQCGILRWFWILFYFLVCLFWDRISLSCPGWNAVVWSQLTATFASWTQAVLPPQPSELLRPKLIGCWDTRLIFKIFLFCRFEISLCYTGWSQTPELKWSFHISLLKCWEYRHGPLCLLRWFSYVIILVF